ncbi:MAG TPA: hypothetical protein VGM37_21085 [Armatimonadota bacterium]|jgi:hypothetical protein
MNKSVSVTLAMILVAMPGASMAAKKPAKPSAKPKAVKPAAVPNKGAGAQQIRALEGPLLTTAFNNGGAQIKFSNLRQSLAWNDDGAGEGSHFILVDVDAANVRKQNITFDLRGRAAADDGKQMEGEGTFWADDMLPASHAKGTIAFPVQDGFAVTKLIMKFGYDLGDPIRAFIPKDFQWNDFGNVAPLGSPASNGLASITMNVDPSVKIPSDWELSEGNKYILLSGRITSLFSKVHPIELNSVKLTSKDGQSFDPYGFISGHDGDVNPNGSRAFKFGFQVPQDVEPGDITIMLGYCTPAPIKFTF